MRRLLPLAAVVAVLGCTAVQQQKAQPPVTDNLQFKNLKVLPPNITRDQLIATMRNFSLSLGTRCEHCHVQVQKEGKQEFDFPSDARSEKNVAREMMRMTAEINRDYVSRVNEHGGAVTCATCHRGHTVPEAWTPPVPAKPAS